MADTDLNSANVGWIGTGRMGLAMASRLLGAGVKLSVWNRTKAKAAPLADLSVARRSLAMASPSSLRMRSVVAVTCSN